MTKKVRCKIHICDYASQGTPDIDQTQPISKLQMLSTVMDGYRTTTLHVSLVLNAGSSLAI